MGPPTGNRVAPGPPGAQKRAKRALLGPPTGKTGQTGSKPTKFWLFYPVEFSGFMHKRPGNGVSPSGLWPFSAFSQNAFRPGDPPNGPESRFLLVNPIIIWEKGNLGALGSVAASLLLGELSLIHI